MTPDFITWVLIEGQEDPVAAWKAMRQQAGWGDVGAAPTGDKKPVDVAPVVPDRPLSTTPKPALSQPIIDALQTGFRTGGKVSDSLVRLLQLNGKNYSLVADGILYARGNAYPFYKEKKAGQPTGNIMFVHGFPIDRLLRELA